MIWGKDGFLLNQTFHKSFSTVVEKPKEDLIIEQIVHYITTYGYESLGLYDEKFVYIPNEKLEVPELESDIKLNKIKGITKEELKIRIWKLCTSGIALSKGTVNEIIELCDYLEITKENIDNVKNKEVKTSLFDKLEILPQNPDEFFRYLIYSLTGKTIVIKDKETIQSLKLSNKKRALKLILKYGEEYGFERLSEIFNRFKPLFLALKTSKSNPEDTFILATSESEGIIAPAQNNNNNINKKSLNDEEKRLNSIINKISHLSKKYHKPMEKNDLDEFIVWCGKHCKEDNFKDVLKNKIKNAGIWRAVKLRNYLQYEKTNLSSHVYKIRNGKAWIQDTPKGPENIIKNDESKEYKDSTNDDKAKECCFNLKNVLEIIDKIIIEKLKDNVRGKKVYLDENIELKLPQSEKQFVGNIPFGSNITINKDNLIFGIQWFNRDAKRVDLDLKLISNNYSIGWDEEYNETDKLIFSGDVTDAPYPNGATECIYIDNTIDECLFSLKVNNYTIDVDNIEYDIIVAKGDRTKIKNNYIIDPNDIIIKIPKNKIEIGKAEHSIGTVIIDNNSIKLIFTDLSAANRMTASNSNLEDILRKFIVEESKCKCGLKEYLEKAGAVFVDNSESADIDLSIDNLTKDSLIRLGDVP